MYVYTSYRYYGQITWTRDCIRHFSGLSLSLPLSIRHHTRLFSRRGRAFLFCHLPGCCIEPSACKCGRSGQWTAPKHILLTSWLNHLESGAFWNHLESSGINISVLPSGALAVNGQGVSARSAEDSVSRSHKKQLQGANVHPQSAWVGAYSVFNFILHLFSTCPTKKMSDLHLHPIHCFALSLSLRWISQRLYCRNQWYNFLSTSATHRWPVCSSICFFVPSKRLASTVWGAW